MPPPPPPPLPNYDYPPATDPREVLDEELSRIRRRINEDREHQSAMRQARIRFPPYEIAREPRPAPRGVVIVADDMLMHSTVRRRRRVDGEDAANAESSNLSSRRLPPLPSGVTTRRRQALEAAPAGPPRLYGRPREGSAAQVRMQARLNVDSLHRMALFRQREANNHAQGSSPDSESDATVQRQTKRRKLVHDLDVIAYDPVIYGWNGQVDPGHLRLEIISCDGGQHPQPRMSRPMAYRVENVLKDDKSVYCSESHECNILFRHQAEALFHLNSLVLQAPEQGYTAPCQQGLVFVGMTAEELVEGAKGYTLAYSKHSSRNFPLTYESRNASSLHLSQQDEDVSSYYWRWHAQPSDTDAIPIEPDSTDDEGTQITTTNAAPSVPTPPADDANDSDASSEDLANEMIPVANDDDMRDALRGILSSATVNTPEVQQLSRNLQNARFGDIMQSLYGQQRQSMRRAAPARVEVDPSREVREANASFFIPKSDSGITINFDPPV
jgi:hypothetical protein